jgi:hypothetical protein
MEISTTHPRSEKSSARLQAILTGLIAALVLIAAGVGVFTPDFYQGIVDPQYATGIITADLIALLCVPILFICIFTAQRGNRVARLIWVSLLIYLGYTYALYVFDRMYTVLFPVYMLLFSLNCFVIVMMLTSLNAVELARDTKNMRLRRTTAIFLWFTGLILYVIELPIIFERIPGGIEAGGTPFMVMDLCLVAPIAILTGIWLWRRHPWGSALTAIFLIKAITIMTSFLIADYIDWFAGRLQSPGATLAFTCVYLLVYVFSWNYFAAFQSKNLWQLQPIRAK